MQKIRNIFDSIPPNLKNRILDPFLGFFTPETPKQELYQNNFIQF